MRSIGVNENKIMDNKNQKEIKAWIRKEVALMWWIAVIAGVIVLIVLWVVSTYNKLVSLREFVRNSMGNIAAQIESRWDAVKSLIDAARKYSDHEAETLANITAMRGKVDRSSDSGQVVKDDNLFAEAMRQLDVVVENYPELKADGVYIQAMQGIDKYENNVRQSRMVYNDTVTKLNRQVQQFPASIVAGMFGFRQESYFESSTAKADMPSW